MDNSEDFGKREIAKATLVKILEKSDLDQEDIDILTLRFSYEWYYDDIAQYVGIKYRGKPYNEGTIRYKIKRSLKKLRKSFVKK